MNRLSIELYLSIQDYLISEDYFCLLNTSKAIFQNFKKEYGYYSLNDSSSHRFLVDEKFQLKVLRVVKDPSRQIAIKIRDESYLSSLFVHKVTCLRYTSSIAIPYLPQISHFSNWGYARDISHCAHFKSFLSRLASSVSDLSPLKDIDDVSIICGRGLPEDIFSSLGRQTKLYLEECPSLTRVESFSNIKQLKLSLCLNLYDIRPLHGIWDLTLRSCPQITDMSVLGNHHKLAIMSCGKRLKGYERLIGIPIVHLSFCDIHDLFVLQFSKEVVLSHCERVEDVSWLRNVRRVTLQNCRGITDVSSLRTVKDLTIENLSFLKVAIDAMEMNNILTAVVTEETAADSWEIHRGVHRLTISSNNTQFFSSVVVVFPYLQYLKISWATINFSLKGWQKIPNIVLAHCRWLKSIEGLGENRHVEIRSCPLITDVSCLQNIPIVKIIGCAGIIDYSCLRNVPRLTIL